MGCSACGRKYQPPSQRVHIDNLGPRTAPIIPKSVYGVVRAPVPQPLPPAPSEIKQAQSVAPVDPEADKQHQLDPSRRKE